MAIKLLLLLGVFIFGFGFTSVVTTVQPEPAMRDPCLVNKLFNLPCAKCKFLTFEQEENSRGLRTFYCPNIPESDSKKEYCCYDLLRRPFCCDGAVFIITGLFWLVVTAAMSCLTWKIFEFLMWFYHTLWTRCFNCM